MSDLDLARLMQTKANGDLSALRGMKNKTIVDFTDFAVQFRYDAFEDFEDDLDRDEIVQKIQNFVDHVEKLLNTASTDSE